MAFNHYAKMKRILADEPSGWYVKRIDQPTCSKNFRGEIVHYDYYYRVYSREGQAIAYCKFQKIDKFASVMGVTVEALPIIT